MKWIAKDPPVYVWKNDTWYNERDKNEYIVDIFTGFWIYNDLKVPFPKKTRIMKENGQANQKD